MLVYFYIIFSRYLCAGSVKLPAAYDSFLNKEQLWNSVKRGIFLFCLLAFYFIIDIF